MQMKGHLFATWDEWAKFYHELESILLKPSIDFSVVVINAGFHVHRIAYQTRRWSVLFVKFKK